VGQKIDVLEIISHWPLVDADGDGSLVGDELGRIVMELAVTARPKAELVRLISSWCMSIHTNVCLNDSKQECPKHDC
jgi:hypothetical protein